MIDLTPLFGLAEIEGSQALSFRVFPRRGAARWILETTHRQPWHLKTWPRANLRARTINRVAWMMATFGLHLPSRVERFAVAPNSPYARLRAEFDRLGIFLGTPGPNRKLVIYAERPGHSVFLKIPLGPASAALVANETAALAELSRDPDFTSLVPRGGLVAGYLAVENIETDGATHQALSVAELTRIHGLLVRRSHNVRKLADLQRDWNAPAGGTVFVHDSRSQALIAAARDTANSFLASLPPDLPIPCYMAHGDFTRWNVLRAANGTARIIDWELYGLRPRHFDLIHYFVSHDLLVAGRPADKVLYDIEMLGQQQFAFKGWQLDVGLYFAFQALYYSSLYERQSNLHKQAIKQLFAWVDALNIIGAKR